METNLSNLTSKNPTVHLVKGFLIKPLKNYPKKPKSHKNISLPKQITFTGPHLKKCLLKSSTNLCIPFNL